MPSRANLLRITTDSIASLVHVDRHFFFSKFPIRFSEKGVQELIDCFPVFASPGKSPPGIPVEEEEEKKRKTAGVYDKL